MISRGHSPSLYPDYIIAKPKQFVCLLSLKNIGTVGAHFDILPGKEKFTLYLSDGWHITSSTDRMENVPVDPSRVDVVFEENATHNPPSQKEIISNWLALPFVNLVLKLYLCGLGFASKRGWTDSGVVDAFENAGAEIVKTDRNLHRMLASQRRYWFISHWAFVLMAIFGIRAWVEFVTPYVSMLVDPLIGILPETIQGIVIYSVFGLELMVWFLFAGVLMTGFLITGTTEARNHAMINQIEDYVTMNPDSTIGCLVVGGAHAPHLRELAKDSDKIQLGESN